MNESFSRFIKLIGEDDFNAMSQKTIAIIGLGGVGGYVVETLARCGISSFILIDYDTVAPSNINRQIIALNSTIGKKKVDAWEERLKDINKDVAVKTFDFVYDETKKDILFSEKIDYLVDACDDIKAKENLISTCLEKNIPFITSMGTGKRLDPSKLYLTDLCKTNYDPIARILRKWVKDNNIKGKIHVVCSKETPKKTIGKEIPTFAPVPSTAGLLITSYIINYFLNDKK